VDGRRFFKPGHVQVLMNMIDFGMNLQEAGDAPRFEHVQVN
jgi:gamma-glutamyltranspeptidase/glutathione hydrolase